jgi:hypothetical protein
MDIIQGIIAGVKDVAAVTSAIEQIGKQLDGARTVILIVENHTNHALRLVDYNHEHGGFAATPHDRINSKEADVFGAKDTGFMTGVDGSIKYEFVEHDEEIIQLLWSNPFMGANSAGGGGLTVGAELPMPPPAPPFQMLVPSARFHVSTVCGAGDKDVEIRYSIRPANKV